MLLSRLEGVSRCGVLGARGLVGVCCNEVFACDFCGVEGALLLDRSGRAVER